MPRLLCGVCGINKNHNQGYVSTYIPMHSESERKHAMTIKPGDKAMERIAKMMYNIALYK